VSLFSLGENIFTYYYRFLKNTVIFAFQFFVNVSEIHGYSALPFLCHDGGASGFLDLIIQIFFCL